VKQQFQISRFAIKVLIYLMPGTICKNNFNFVE
jgi:hypothetical protein